MKIIENDIEEGRLDSVWYGGNVVRLNVGYNSVSIDAVGDVRCIINGTRYVDKSGYGRMAQYLEENGITNDDELHQAIEEGRVVFENNNWYEIKIYNEYEGYWWELGDNIVDAPKPDDDFKWVIDLMDCFD